MHAVIVNVTITDPEGAMAELGDQVVPRISQAPGFVAGYWVRLAGNKGTSIVAFDSEEQAQTASEQVRMGRGAVTFDSVEVGEVVAHA
jgi:ribosomal protein L35AE/L33A